MTVPADTPTFRSRRRPAAAPAPARQPPAAADTALADARLLDAITSEYALRHQVLPVGRRGSVTLVAAPDLATFESRRPWLERVLGPVAAVLMSGETIRQAIGAARGPQLARRAERRTPANESVRGWSSGRTGALFLAIVALVAAGAATAPEALFALLAGWAIVTLAALTGLRTVAALAQLRASRGLEPARMEPPAVPRRGHRLPAISLLVPLYREDNIVPRLLERLQRLDYPPDRLEALLILEQDDDTTAAALAAAPLPGWMRTVAVPPASLRTKPRALNYALDFARGDIIGIYDAEDAPAPDQLLKVAQAFEAGPRDVACLQGVLDFYNARHNWLTRCFAIDYAVWFRLVLPGLVRLGIPIPLGGTTVFLRRDVLDSIGRWDAHNVTEDADLGIRLARHGFRTAFIPSVTLEEATATIPAWLRQRSRWIKGYAMTWVAHARAPVALWRELGARRFLGVQILLLGSVSQFVLAPVLWSFWLVVLGLPHPLESLAPRPLMLLLTALFLACEVTTLAVAGIAVAAPPRRRLIWWIPLLHLYFPLSAIACWKGLAELASRPFFWDKTTHGAGLSARRSSRRPRHPA